MDAQNAAGSDKAKPPASPARPAPQPGDDADKPSLKAPSKDLGSEADGKSPEPSSDKTKPASKSPRDADDEAAADRDSDAETIVLPGKDGHSPSKARKVKHEDNSDVEDLISHRKRRDTEPSKSSDRDRNSLNTEGLGKKKASRADRDSLRPDKPSKNQDGSSGLSSAPTSPPNNRRRPAPARDSDSDGDRKRSPKLSNKDRAKSTDQMVSHKRKASRAASDDEHAEERKAQRRRRLEDRPEWLAAKEKSITSKEGKTAHRDQRSVSSKWAHDNHNGRSASPPPRAHRRSISTQLPSNPANGLSHKKKRLPAPLRSTEYHSDESSASGSPHPRNSKVRNLSTPATAESNTSPAKMPSSKRHVDAHGQTPLARACTKGEFDVAKQRLMERPDDINFADYAGNTPLQSAAINGFDNIVKLLIDAGCDVDCMNDQKDTPLLDAVENGHLDVVKLLLEAGVNPRKANLQGEEPLDRIGDDLDNADEIREALMAAKQRRTGTRKTSEDLHGDHPDGSSHGADDSPRHSPAPAPPGRRPGNTRGQTTSNHHLYVNLDDKTLRLAAAKGDEETVTRVLQVKDRCDNPEAMVGAARGGHEVVLQLLLALGGADPDPAPVPSLQPEFATPMLAAIGQENINVVKLLLDQAKFDPTRRYKGLTYYEIAESRQGTNWKEEEQILKDAYDAYEQKPQRDGKNKSPRRERARAQEREAGRPTARSTTKEESRAPRRNLSSPSRELEGKKKPISRPVTSPKEKRRSQSFSQHDDQKSLKRGPGRLKKEDNSAAATASDREPSPGSTHKVAPKPKKAESDMAALSSEGETVKPRRKLVSKGELRGEREKQRRASMASNTSSQVREPPSPREPRPDEPSDKTKEPLSEKYHDRTKALKRDESRERPAGDNIGKRHRSSVTPPHPSSGEKDSDAPVKRRRLDSDGKERRIRHSDSHDERKSSRESSNKAKLSSGEHDDRRKSGSHTSEEINAKGNGKPSSANDKTSIHIKPEQADVEMPDAPTVDEEAQKREAEAEAIRKKADQERQQREADEKKREEEAKQREAERLKQEEEAARRREEEEKARKAEEERKRAEEESRLKREAEEAKRREAERQAREKEEERKRKEEEERRQREEEELLRKQQLEREAAEEARRQKEEEERKERETRDRLKREEAERKRAAHEAEVRRLREEERQQRLAKLPPLLRWFDQCTNPQTPEVAKKLLRLVGVRYDTIRPGALGTPEGREQWVLNTHVALLLGIKDLELARFTAWERLPVSDLAKQVLWMLERDQYALVGHDMIELGTQVQGLYSDDEPLPKLHIQTMNRLRQETMPLFRKLDMFFVKLSDLLYIIPSFPHLRDLELVVTYKELPQDEANLTKSPRNFKNDPDNARYLGFGPGWKKYVNGELVSEKLPRICATSSTPFPEKRVPRRGLQQVYPDDPDYARICREQGLDHLLSQNKYQKSPSLPNGVHPSPPMSHEEVAPDMAEAASPIRADGTL